VPNVGRLEEASQRHQKSLTGVELKLGGLDKIWQRRAYRVVFYAKIIKIKKNNEWLYLFMVFEEGL